MKITKRSRKGMAREIVKCGLPLPTLKEKLSSALYSVAFEESRRLATTKEDQSMVASTILDAVRAIFPGFDEPFDPRDYEGSGWTKDEQREVLARFERRR
jgi:hypothetical protein